MSDASLLLRNAHIYTQDRSYPHAEALAIEGERIVWVGREDDAQAWLGAHTREIDLGGKLVVPGLIDSHFHLLQGAKGLYGAQLDRAENVADLQAIVRKFAAAHPERPWITGRGWQYKAFSGGASIHRAVLDQVVSDRPALLIAFDGHTAIANTAALEKANLLHGPAKQPDFGSVVMGSDGTATGELRETAAIDLVRNLVPAMTDDERDALLREALKQCASYGITSVHNMDGNLDTLNVLRDFDGRGELSVRVYVPLSVEPGMTEADIEHWANTAHGLQTDLVRTGSVKLFADGVVENKTAWMIDPYDDGSGDRGGPNFKGDDFQRLILKADAMKQQIMVHAIGDQAVRATLDAFHQARRMNGPRDARYRVEHVEVLDPRDLTRFGRMHVIASVQPLHADFSTDSDNPWQRLVGRQRWGWGFPWRALRLADVPLAFGSDWPVVAMNPFEGMHAGLTRIKLDFSGQHSTFPNHRLTLNELLDGYTTNGAYAEFQENEKGQLRLGMLADLAVLDQDLVRMPQEDLPERIAATKSLLTIVNGRIVHETL